MRYLTKRLTPALLGLGLAAMASQALAYPWHGGWGWRGYPVGPRWGGVGVGVVVSPYPYYYYGAAPIYPSYVVVQPPPVGADSASPPSRDPATSSQPNPVIYPRNGQDASRTEADRQDCNRWAASQPGAATESGIFQRATEACMDGRGYTLR